MRDSKHLPLVVGAGPTGLTLACELWRHGVGCRLIDAADGPTTESRALGVQSRTLEVFEDLGVLPEALARGRRVHAMNAYTGDQRIAHVSFDELDAPYPFVLILPQADTEAILRERLAALGGSVEQETVLVDLVAPEGDGPVTVEIAGPGGGHETYAPPWVIGCDGAHSAVRKLLDLPFDGSEYAERLVLADLRIDWDRRDDELHIFLSPDGIFAAFPQPGGVWRLVAQVTGDEDAGEPTLATFEELLAARGPSTAATLSDPSWIAAFRIHRRMVPSYRRGRVFVAGDAAHIHSPVGGQGMNTGIQDAYNLGWKLALAERGRARPALLESYHPERHPIAQATLDATDAATRMVMLRHPIGRALRNRLAPVLLSLEVVQRRATERTSEIGLHYRQSPIVSGHHSSILHVHLIADRTSQAPSVVDWVSFEAGPRPGDRAPDVELFAERTEGDAVTPPPRLFPLLAGPHHTLLLFDGAAATEAGYRNLEDVAAAVEERYGGLVHAIVVVPMAERPAELAWTGDVIFDADRALHSRYGAGAECLYLVRPDGHVGFRGQPAEAGPLVEHLDRILVPLAEAGADAGGRG